MRQSLIYIKIVYSTGRADIFCQIRNTKEKNVFQNIKLNDVLKSIKVCNAVSRLKVKSFYQQFLKNMINYSYNEKCQYFLSTPL